MKNRGNKYDEGQHMTKGELKSFVDLGERLSKASKDNQDIMLALPIQANSPQ